MKVNTAAKSYDAPAASLPAPQGVAAQSGQARAIAGGKRGTDRPDLGEDAARRSDLGQDGGSEKERLPRAGAIGDGGETLGVPPTADAGTIRRAWARLAHARHSDKGGAQEQMVRLNAAYERAGRP